MATALVDGTQIMEWGGLTLHGNVSGWKDRRVRRIAQHTFDRRDGAQSEDMGRSAHVTDCTLVFDNADGLSTLRKFLRLWDENPTRLLVHPIYGRMNATFIGIESGQLSVDQGANVYNVSGQFVESNINADTVADATQSVPGRAAAVDSQVLLVTANVAASVSFSTAALRTTVATFTNAASAFSVAATASADLADPALAGLLSASLSAGTAATLAIRAATNDGPEAADAVIACEILTANLLDLGAATQARRPSLIEYRVGETTHLLALAGQIYGSDAVSRITEIRTLNPSVIGVVVTAGQSLLLAAA